MATDAAERKAIRHSHVGAPPPEPEHLPCPRCDSTNTKFCYYNNYNFSQPRHFCKSCRRYWTHGGTLRDIPVGGGSRKNAKRSRTNISSAGVPTNATFFSSPHHELRNFPVAAMAAAPFLVPLPSDHAGTTPFSNDAKMCGSFTSLLSNSQGTSSLLSLGGLGFGIGPGLEDMGFGLGRPVWSISGVPDNGPATGLGMGGHTWQLENSEAGVMGGGDCFTLPDLAISTPGTFMK